MSRVLLTATRLHLKYEACEHYVGGSEHDCLTFLNFAAATRLAHLFQYSPFIVAEIGGQRAGVLSGYDPTVSGLPIFTRAQTEVFQKAGWNGGTPKAAFKRHIPFMTCAPEDWVVESVAVPPEFRRPGVIRALLVEVLERGRRNGYPCAQIGVLIDNAPAGWLMKNKDFIP